MAKFLHPVKTAETVLEMARERIRHAYSIFDHIVVSFSGGKDSTVCLNLTIQIAQELGKLPVHAIFYDEEAMPWEVEHYVRRTAQRPEVELDWVCIQVKHTNACSNEASFWVPWNPAERDLWVRPLPAEAITEVKGYNPDKEIITIPAVTPIYFDPGKYGTVGFVMGIRADESMTRRRAVSNREAENYIVRIGSTEGWGGGKVSNGNVYKVMPIYDWKTADVWTAPNLFNWDYCAAYDLMEMAGVTHSNQRVAPPYGSQPMLRLHTYRTCFPDVWDKIVRRVPGANTAAMYAHTELYGKGGVEKPDWLTWPEYIKQLLVELPDAASQRYFSKVIGKYMKTHSQRTNGGPIAPTAFHPLTGICWEFLAMKIIKRDNKERMLPSFHYVGIERNPEKYAQAMAEYDRQVAMMKADKAGLSEEGTRF